MNIIFLSCIVVEQTISSHMKHVLVTQYYESYYYYYYYRHMHVLVCWLFNLYSIVSRSLCYFGNLRLLCQCECECTAAIWRISSWVSMIALAVSSCLWMNKTAHRQQKKEEEKKKNGKLNLVLIRRRHICAWILYLHHICYFRFSSIRIACSALSVWMPLQVILHIRISPVIAKWCYLNEFYLICICVASEKGKKGDWMTEFIWNGA